MSETNHSVTEAETPLSDSAQAGAKKRLSDLYALLKEGFAGRVWPVSAAVSLYLASFWMWLYLYGFGKFWLTSFSDRVIGAAIAGGIDPTARRAVFYSALLVLLVAFVGMTILLALWRRRSKARNELDCFASEWQLLRSLGLFLMLALITQFSRIFFVTSGYEPPHVQLSVWTPALLIALTLLGMLAKTLLLKNEKTRPAALARTGEAQWTRLMLSMLLSVSAVFACWTLWKGTRSIEISTLPVVACYCVFYALLRLLLIRVDLSRAGVAAIPLSCIPIAVPIACEMQYTLSLRFDGLSLSPRLIAAALFFGLCALSLLLYLLKKRGRTFAPEKVLENVILPIFLASFAAICCYTGSADVSEWLDTLHFGNKIVPIQQLLQFGKVPFLDYWGAQHFPLGDLLYALFNDYRGLENTLWYTGVNAMLFILTGYYVVKLVIPYRWAFGAFLYLSLYALMNAYSVGAFLPLLYLKRLTDKRGTLQYTVFLALSLLVFAWMSAMGKAAVLASFAVLLLLDFSKGGLIKLAKATLFVFVIPASVYFALVALRGESVADRLALIQTFTVVDLSAVSLKNMVWPGSSNLDILLVYAVCPVAVVALLTVVLLRKEKTQREYIGLFVAVATLSLLIRSLGRHGLLEGGVGSIYRSGYLLLMLLPFLNANRDGFRSRLCYVSIVLGFCLIPTWGAGSVNPLYALTGVEYGASDLEGGRYRVSGAEARPDALLETLDACLDEDQTFFEMVNAHLLYTLAEREAPVLHHAIHVVATEDAQTAYVHTLQRRYEKDEIPIVILGAEEYPYTSLENLPPELRAFRVAEFIHQNYRPWKRVDGYDLWLANNSDIPEKLGEPFAEMDVSQNYALDQLAYIWGTYDERAEEIKQNVLYEAEAGLALNETHDIALPASLEPGAGNYIYLRIYADWNGPASLTYGDGQENGFTFTVLAGTHDYLIRAGTQYDWSSQRVPSLRLSCECAGTIERIAIAQGE